LPPVGLIDFSVSVPVGEAVVVGGEAVVVGGAVVVAVVAVVVSGAFFSWAHEAVKPTIVIIAAPPTSAAARRAIGPMISTYLPDVSAD
jgi:hypothetical protein